MLKTQPNPTFKTDVLIPIAGGKPAKIEIEFKYLSRSKVKDYFENLTDKQDEEALAEIVVGWSGVQDEYSQEALAVLLDNYASAAKAIFDTFRTEIFKVATKN